jgi:iron-sulfur cluster assembly protein
LLETACPEIAWNLKEVSDVSITITERAADHVKKYLANRGHGIGIRLGVRTNGCSGLAYVLEFVDEKNPEDEVFQSLDVTIFVDPKSVVYLEGTEMDYVKENLNEGFQFNNPNKKGECGCGESFTV